MASGKGEYVMPDHSDELFCGNDGGGGPYWLTAEGRSASDALRIVESVDGTDDGVTIQRTFGRFIQTSEGPRVVIDEDGEVEFWEIET